MINKKNIQEEIEKTLQSIDGAERAKANPFLFTRIQARLDARKSGWANIISFMSRPVFAYAVIAFVLLANAWTIYSHKEESDLQGSSVISTSSDLPEEYNLAVNTFYDYETP